MAQFLQVELLCLKLAQGERTNHGSISVSKFAGGDESRKP